MIVLKDKAFSMQENYFIYLKTVNYSANTVRSYQKDLDSFNLFLAQNSFSELLFSSDEARHYLLTMSKKGFKASSIKRHISTLKGYYHFLMKHEMIKNNPFAYIKAMRGAKRLPHQLFYSDIMAMIEHCSNDLWGLRDRAIIESLYSTGCRAFELVALNKSDVLGRSALNIKGKGSKNRFIFFNQKAQEAIACYLKQKGLAEHHHESDGQRALFINHHGIRLTTRGLYYIVKEYEQFLPHGRKVGVHAFRHSFASHLLNEGASLRGVQELLGHSNLSSTQIYTHVGLDRMKELYRSAHPHAKKRAINKRGQV